ncbi:hypothetical protein [Streptomyces sp. NPDC004728]|uniref:hypothetical protein n=1 Tax=Streptomyces sp. NPDC004728 TaxID=3154289 RepID=UPI0033BECA53
MPASKAFWTEYFNDAYEAASKKRREVIDRGLLLIAHVIREELPTATAITIHRATAQLVAVHDTESTIWRADDEATRSKLRGRTVVDIEETILDILFFARTAHPLLAADWKHAKGQADAYRAELPKAPGSEEQSTAPAATDRPHGTPGKGAGNCAQCKRLLIWDGSGKRVNDEWGEYLCHDPRPGGTRSAVHVLTAPDTTNRQPAAQS